MYITLKNTANGDLNIKVKLNRTMNVEKVVVVAPEV